MQINERVYFPLLGAPDKANYVKEKQDDTVLVHTLSVKAQLVLHAAPVCNASSLQVMEHLVQLNKVVLKHFGRMHHIKLELELTHEVHNTVIGNVDF